MFKKKVKKDQGVLNLQQIARPLQEQSQRHEQKQVSSLLDIKPQQLGHPLGEKSLKISDAKQDPSQNTPQNFIKNHKEQFGGQRNKNQQLAYLDDADQFLQNGPKKRLKDSNGVPKQKHIIGGNSLQRQAQIGEAVHSAFEGMNFKAGAKLIEDLQLPASELEEELAKRRYMENVQATRQAKEGKGSSGIYKGLNAYTNHKMTKNDLQNAQEAYKKKMGPSRINSTIKNSCRFDYVLNLCKDWHDSGYCPFGNSCLYLHDRSNYKTGWQLEKDFEISERQRWQRINNPELAKKEDKQKLLKTIEKHKPQQICPVCSQVFRSPVQIQCGHLYCTPCAIKLVKCKECGKRLSGIMNNAEQKLQKQKTLYDEMVIRLQASQEDSLAQRRKFQNTDSLDVFAD